MVPTAAGPRAPLKRPQLHTRPALIPADAGVLAPPHSNSVRAEWRWLITSLAPPRVNERIRHCARRMEKIRQPLSSRAKRGFDVAGASEAPFPATPSPSRANSPAAPGAARGKLRKQFRSPGGRSPAPSAKAAARTPDGPGLPAHRDRWAPHPASPPADP